MSKCVKKPEPYECLVCTTCNESTYHIPAKDNFATYICQIAHAVFHCKKDGQTFTIRQKKFAKKRCMTHLFARYIRSKYSSAWDRVCKRRYNTIIRHPVLTFFPKHRWTYTDLIKAHNYMAIPIMIR